MLDAVREIGAGLSRLTERWVPDAWVICMMLTAIALLLSVFGAGAGVEEAALAWGSGVWNLLTLAMQFTIALVAAHACVASPPVHRLLDRLARLPDPEKPVQAVLLCPRSRSIGSVESGPNRARRRRAILVRAVR